LIELARSEECSRLQLVDNRGLANAGITRNEDQLGEAALDDPIERGEQGFDLVPTPIKYLGDDQPVRCVPLAKLKIVDVMFRVPFGSAVAEVLLESGGRLITIFGHLRE
jgi:hypothetical protein